jgi:hypothetical protein
MAKEDTRTREKSPTPRILQIVQRIQRRKEQQNGKMRLSGELSISLDLLQDLLRRGGLAYREIAGGNIIFHEDKPDAEKLTHDIEAYSIKMLVSGLKIQRRGFFSLTLNEPDLRARQEILAALEEILERVQDPQAIAEIAEKHTNRQNQPVQKLERADRMGKQSMRRAPERAQNDRVAREQQEQAQPSTQSRRDRIMAATLLHAQPEVRAFLEERPQVLFAVFDSMFDQVQSGDLPEKDAPERICRVLSERMRAVQDAWAERIHGLREEAQGLATKLVDALNGRSEIGPLVGDSRILGSVQALLRTCELRTPEGALASITAVADGKLLRERLQALQSRAASQAPQSAVAEAAALLREARDRCRTPEGWLFLETVNTTLDRVASARDRARRELARTTFLSQIQPQIGGRSRQEVLGLLLRVLREGSIGGHVLSVPDDIDFEALGQIIDEGVARRRGEDETPPEVWQTVRLIYDFTRTRAPKDADQGDAPTPFSQPGHAGKIGIHLYRTLRPGLQRGLQPSGSLRTRAQALRFLLEEMASQEIHIYGMKGYRIPIDPSFADQMSWEEFDTVIEDGLQRGTKVHDLSPPLWQMIRVMFNLLKRDCERAGVISDEEIVMGDSAT